MRKDATSTIKTVLGILAAPLVVVGVAAMPLMLESARGAPRLAPGRAIEAVVRWFGGLADGSSFRYVFGTTTWSFFDVAPRFFMVSFLYIALAGSAGMALGLVLGIRSRRGESGPVMRVVDTISTVPDFIVAIILQLVVITVLDRFGVKLSRISYDASSPVLILLPFVLMAFYPFAHVYRAAARSARDARTADWAVYARAKGVHERDIVRRHVGAAVVPAIGTELPTLLAMMQANLFVTEFVFSLPGITRFLFTVAFSGRSQGWMEFYQYPVAVAVLLGILLVYAAAWAFFRGALALLRAGLTGER